MNNHRSQGRIYRELKEITSDPPTNIIAGLIGNDLSKWSATIMGPDESPYEGGFFDLEITFPKDYPFKPPEIRFRTKIYHCNISILLSICSFLNDPNPDNPVRKSIGRLYKQNRARHDRNVRKYTRQYAQSYL
ncbi:ubiquitin-conjugating enzyme e2 5b-like [Anaeramoeba flamelloides]|uniref:Ubiquitin-conjugating enzyme e2 5b-like n=1 Tax=Anaeramoeba flamelloides TaxID=1746091 RepID=A0AAV7ZRY1_9EUKA|nr:ubiquitin-conjugating enzyme e2 5b-like [Anaeramoeba flamelloides]